MAFIVSTAAPLITAPVIGVGTVTTNSVQIVLVTPSTAPLPLSGYVLSVFIGAFDLEDFFLTSFPFTVPGLTSGTTYGFKALAVENSGNNYFSAPSALVSASTGGTGTIPAQVTGLTANALSGSSIALSWNADIGATSYTIKRNGGVIVTGFTSTTFSDTGLMGSTSYTYNVAGVNAAGTGPFSASAVATTQGFWNPPGPLLADYRIGSPQAYGTAWQNWALPHALCIISSQFTAQISGGFAALNGYTKQSVLDYLRAHDQVPGGKKIFQYVIADSDGSAATPMANYANARNWYLYVNGTSGTKVANFFDPAWNQYNATASVASDANGRKLEDYFAFFSDINFRTDAGGQGAQGATNCASVDGFFHDNLFKWCRENGAFDLGGTENAQTSPWPLNWRTGELRFFTQMASTFPGGLMIGNLDGPANEGSYNAATEYNPLTGNINGGMLEGGMGIYFSPNSFANLRSEILFRKQVAGSMTPNIVIMGVQNLTATGQLPTAYSSNSPSAFSPNYQGERYAIGVAMLFNIFMWWTTSQSYSDTSGLTNFDEFGGNIAQYPAGYAGQFLSGPVTLSNGMQRSDYQNCIVVVNEGGSGAKALNQTILGGNFWRQRGVQNPGFNNAQQVTDANPVNLGDSGALCGDAVILMRTAQ